MHPRLHGYRNMGRDRIPRPPIFTIMVDRDDGTEWVLFHNGAVDTVGITDEVSPKRGQFINFGTKGGPYLWKEGHLLRLLVRGGRLGHEEVKNPAYVERLAQHRIMTRVQNKAEALEIIVPSTWVRFPNVLGFEEFSF